MSSSVPIHGRNHRPGGVDPIPFPAAAGAMPYASWSLGNVTCAKSHPTHPVQALFPFVGTFTTNDPDVFRSNLGQLEIIAPGVYMVVGEIANIWMDTTTILGGFDIDGPVIVAAVNPDIWDLRPAFYDAMAGPTYRHYATGSRQYRIANANPFTSQGCGVMGIATLNGTPASPRKVAIAAQAASTEPVKFFGGSIWVFRMVDRS